MKADSTFTIAELKDVIRSANKPNKYRKGAGLKLTGSKKELQARLKSVGRWREVAPAKKVAPKKVAPTKKVAPKKVVPKKAVPKKPTMTKVLMNYDMDVSSLIGKAAEEAREVKKATTDFDFFIQDVMMGDDEFDDERYEREMEVVNQFSWGSGFQKVLPKIKGRKAGKEGYDELSESQKEDFQWEAVKMATDLHLEYIEDVWKGNIKGKKFNSMKQLRDAFMKKYLD